MTNIKRAEGRKKATRSPAQIFENVSLSPMRFDKVDFDEKQKQKKKKKQ